MMLNHRALNTNRSSLQPATATRLARAIRHLGAAALGGLAACGMAACASPFGTAGGDGGGQGLYRSILAHDLADGHLLTQPSVMPVDQGVHEMPATAANNADAAVIPATTQGGAAVALHGHPPSTSMTLRQAIEDALSHNLSIKIQAYVPSISQTQIIQAQAAFDPSLVSSVQYQHLNEPTPFPSTLGGSFPIGMNNEDQLQSQIGVKKLLSTGGTISLTGSDNYQDFHSSSGLPPDINPSHTADLGIELKQPLLRGFGVTVNHADIYIARRNQQIALSDFRREVIRIVARVERTYVQLNQARTEVRIEEQLLRHSRRTLQRLRTRLHMDVDSVQISQAKAAVDLAQYGLVSAQRQTGDLSEKLKALLNDPAFPAGPGPAIKTANKLVAEPLAFDLRHDIATALAQRGIMRRDRMNIEKDGIRQAVAKNALLPKANLIAATDSSGLTMNGSLPGAFRQAITSPNFGFSVGLNVDIPLGNRAARAALYRRRLLRRQALTRMLKDAQNIARDIASDLINLTADWSQIRVARKRRLSAAMVLRGLKVEELSGHALSPTFLQLQLNAQENLAEAQIAQSAAVAAYNLDLVQFERDKGSLLEFDRVAISPAGSQ